MRRVLIHKIFLFFFIFILNRNAFCLIKNVVNSVKVIKVDSLEQKITNFKNVTLTGNVEVLIDNKLHVWADEVEIDKENETLIAHNVLSGAVIIETKDLLILADKFFFNLKDKTGCAQNLRVHLPEGYFCAKTAEKINEDNWKLEDLVFTPCDAHIPHWSIVARRAILYKNYLVRITGLLFKAGPIPFFTLPYMAMPLQKRSKSGFLVPKFAYDDDLGIGLRQEFYWSIANRCDSTISLDWRERKGLALIDEFRWARKEESFTFLNLRYALEKNAFVKKRDRIEQDTDRRYWIDGKDFRHFKDKSGRKFDSLLRVDFGTDKKISYQFFDNFLRVDDTFYNSLIFRYIGATDVSSIFLDSNQTTKSKFLELTDSEKQDIFRRLTDSEKGFIDLSQKEIEDEFFVLSAPQLEWNNNFNNFLKIFNFRQDFFLDHIFSREKKLDRFYVNSKVVRENDFYYLAKADSFRLFYNADLLTDFKFKDQAFLFYLSPNFQIRTNIRNRGELAKKNVLETGFLGGGASRLFLSGGAEWIMPELFFEENYKYNYYLQPILSWDFLPKFKQDHWYHSDKWDRFYPKNKLALNLKSSWCIDNAFIDLNLSQAVDFYNKEDRFYLERTPHQKHLFPLEFELGLDCDVVNVFFKQEYEWKRLQLLTSQLNLSFDLKDFNLYLATVYQNQKVQLERGLFSDIPNFLILSLTVPLVKNAKLSYEGQFYSQKKSLIFPFEGLRPLQHAIKLEYEGHCWGISLGYEEKHYKEYGNWKSDKAYTLFVKLESLGSFARKFKKPANFSGI
jgi:lipopolysaccharide assembly outer membrane protein LptD (OstA)